MHRRVLRLVCLKDCLPDASIPSPASVQLTLLDLGHHAGSQQPDADPGLTVYSHVHSGWLQVAVHPAEGMQLPDCLQPRGSWSQNILLDTAQGLGGEVGAD